MEKTKKSIFSKIFVCLSLCLVLLGALAPCFSMNKNQPLKADSVVNYGFTFNGSDLYIPETYYTNNNFSNESRFNAFFISFSCNAENKLQSLTINIIDSLNFGSLNSLVQSITIKNFNEHTYYFGGFYDSSVVEYKHRVYVNYSNLVDGTVIMGEPIFVRVSGTFVNAGINYLSTRITYYDANNNFIEFYIACRSDYISQFEEAVREFALTERTYYFSNSLNLTDNQYYNQGFDAGYSDGYNKGNTDGNNTGYQNGYEAGNAIGFENGYNKGLNDSNQYTFLNLVSATIDAPFQYFQSLFNFDLLGVNLSSFLLAIFTVCVVVTIIKLCLGR